MVAHLRKENGEGGKREDKEVAAKLTCGIRTVERKLERTRAIWVKEITP